jgi:hypothetical protein
MPAPKLKGDDELENQGLLDEDEAEDNGARAQNGAKQDYMSDEQIRRISLLF